MSTKNACALILLALYMSGMEKTPLLQDLSRGLKSRCPNCGKGRLFARWLKVAPSCEVCGEEYHHHRADDFPAYVVIIIMGHVMVTFALWLEETYAPPFWVHLATIIPMTIILCIALLQPVKGAIVALQWRIGMHGFREAHARRHQSSK